MKAMNLFTVNFFRKKGCDYLHRVKKSDKKKACFEYTKRVSEWVREYLFWNWKLTNKKWSNASEDKCEQHRKSCRQAEQAQKECEQAKGKWMEMNEVDKSSTAYLEHRPMIAKNLE